MRSSFHSSRPWPLLLWHLMGPVPLGTVLLSIAAKHTVTPAAVLLSWAIGNSVIPITTTIAGERMNEYLSPVTLKLLPQSRNRLRKSALSANFAGGERPSFSLMTGHDGEVIFGPERCSSWFEEITIIGLYVERG